MLPVRRRFYKPDVMQPVQLCDIQAHIDHLFLSAGGMAARRTVEFILEQGVLWNASDIHLNPENEAATLGFRIDGVLQHLAEISH